MTNYKEKTTTKTIRTVLFLGLIMTLMVPLAGINTSHAVQADVVKKTLNAEEIDKNTKKIQEFKQKALKDGDIPDTELLKRYGSEWVSQYKSTEEFDKYQEGIESYVNGQHENNGWNQAMVKSHTKIHNFETIIGKVGYGHEITLLVAEKNRLQGNYNPPEQVRKYHEWIAIQYSVPHTVKEIDDRLGNITGDAKFIKLAEKTAREFDNLAKHGSVPSDLFDSDVDYWVFASNVAVCEYNSPCDPAAMKASQEITPNELAEITSVDGFWQYILPEVFALTKQNVSYNLFTYINLSACDYQNCYEAWQLVAVTGSKTINIMNYLGVGGTPEHATRNAMMTFYGSACPNVTTGTPINEVTTTPYLANALDTAHTKNQIKYPTCAITSTSFTATNNWIVGIKATSPGSYKWV